MKVHIGESCCFFCIFRGMDPIIFCGLCGVASAGVGFAAGTVAFKSVWKLFNKDLAQNMQEVCFFAELIL